MNQITEKAARPARTLMQASPAFATTEGIDAWLYDMNDRQYGVTIILLTMLFSFFQTAYEDYKGRAVLRNVTPNGVPNVTVPIVD